MRDRMHSTSVSYRDWCRATTGTPLSRLRHAEQWGCYARLLCDDFRSVERLAIHPELSVSASTIYRWRHRFLRGLSWVGLRLLDGLVEADETFLRRSFKRHRGWRQDNPPIDRKPRYRGGPIRHKGLGKFHVTVVTAMDRQDGEYNEVLERRGEVTRAFCDIELPPGVCCTPTDIADIVVWPWKPTPSICVSASAGGMIRTAIRCVATKRRARTGTRQRTPRTHQDVCQSPSPRGVDPIPGELPHLAPHGSANPGFHARDPSGAAVTGLTVSAFSDSNRITTR